MSAAKNLSIRLAAVGGDKVRQEFKALGNDGQKAFRQITNVITPANDNLLKLNENTKVFNNILRQASYVAGAFLGFKGISGTLGALFESNRNFEQLSASLKTVIGSTENAQAAFTLIENFATATPYQLNEVVEAFIRLKALGLDPSEEALTSYGNTASAFSKNILDFVEAVADATVGEFERLKSFGIKANTLTNEVKFTFAGVTTTVKKNATDIEKYLRSLGDIKFARAMSEQMKTNFANLAESTVKNAFSNMEDALTTFVTTGKASFSDFANAIISDLTRIIIRQSITQPLLNGIASYFGFATAHTGGIVGSDNLRKTYASPAVFFNAPKFHGGGIVGDEVPIIAKRGEGVFTREQMKAIGDRESTVNISVNVINNASSDVKTSVTKSNQGNGKINLDIMIEKIENSMAKNVSKGTGLAPVLERRYGLNPAYGSYG